MSVFVVTDKQTGQEAHRYAAQDVVTDGYPLAAFDHTPLPEGATDLPPPAVRRLTKLQFVGRFGSDFDTLFALSETNIEVKKFMRMLDWATPDPDGTSVDLDDPRVITALAQFEQAGLLAVSTANSIRGIE